MQTRRGAPLLALPLLWLAARTACHVPALGIVRAAVFDTLFALHLAIAASIPIVRKRQWRQSGIVAKLILVGTGNPLFYLGVTSQFDQGTRWGLYTGSCLVIWLILTISRRLIPFFIERGLKQPVELRNSSRVDIAALVCYLAFFCCRGVCRQPRAGRQPRRCPVFLLHAWRLAGWHTSGLWRKPLLWSLYLPILTRTSRSCPQRYRRLG